MVPMVAPSVLDQMVIEQILVQQAGKMGVEVSDAGGAEDLPEHPLVVPGRKFRGR